MINLFNYTRALPSMTSRNVCSKGYNVLTAAKHVHLNIPLVHTLHLHTSEPTLCHWTVL